MTATLLQALQADAGIVCAIGAGGKKTTLHALMAASTGRTGLTASVFTPHFPDSLGARIIVAELHTVMERVPADTAARIAYGVVTDKPRRVGPLDESVILALHRLGRFDLTLVKADGARMRRIKAPGSNEPRVVTASTVLAITSVQAIGRPLDERIAHRPERISDVTGTPLGEPVSVDTIARLYAGEGGLLQGTDGCHVVAVLNMVDDDKRLRQAKEAAAAILDASERLERVALLSNRRPGQLVDVILR